MSSDSSQSRLFPCSAALSLLHAEVQGRNARGVFDGADHREGVVTAVVCSFPICIRGFDSLRPHQFGYADKLRVSAARLLERRRRTRASVALRTLWSG